MAAIKMAAIKMAATRTEAIKIAAIKTVAIKMAAIRTESTPMAGTWAMHRDSQATRWAIVATHRATVLPTSTGVWPSPSSLVRILPT
jgi:hypothetical protein